MDRATEGRGRTSFIRAADAGTVRELIKYVTKIADLVGDAPALDEFLTAVARKRLVRTYGTFYDVPVDDEENPARRVSRLSLARCDLARDCSSFSAQPRFERCVAG